MLHSPGAQPTAIAYCGLGLQHTCFVGLFSCTIPVLFLDCQGLEHLVFNHGIFFFPLFPFVLMYQLKEMYYQHRHFLIGISTGQVLA
jgi:hypothetical protein